MDEFTGCLASAAAYPHPRGFLEKVRHKGQGRYFDPEFRFHGVQRRTLKGYHSSLVTDLALDWLWQQKGDRPWTLIIGHKAPHSFYEPEPKYEYAFDYVNIRYPASAFLLDDKPTW